MTCAKAQGFIPDEQHSRRQVQVPCMAEQQGTVMVADITGFTRLTERLGKQGTAGVELLTKCINNYFTRVSILACHRQPCLHV